MSVLYIPFTTETPPRPFLAHGLLHGGLLYSFLLFSYLAPATRAVVGDNGLKQVQQRPLVNGLTLADLYRPRRQVALALIDDAFGIGRYGIIDEDVEMIPGP
jgi:hypothetical protein